MNGEKKKAASFDELNDEFSTNVKNKKRKKKKRRVILVLFLIAAIVGAAIWGVNTFYFEEGNSLLAQIMRGIDEYNDDIEEDISEDSTSEDPIDDTEENIVEEDIIEDIVEEDNTEDINSGTDSILTEEEMKEWLDKEVDINGETVYIELNDKIEVVNQRAFIRLINPIFSSHSFVINLYADYEKAEYIYTSQMISPGTILEAIMLDRELSEDELSAVVEYVVYDNEGNELGSYPINVEFKKTNSQN
ncbi:MAG: hypothetical protein ACK5LL_05340 [Suipraeoptans sp.]